MIKLSREAKIGLFLGVTLLILAVFIFVVGDMSRLFRRPGYPLLTSFDSALGLETNTVVRMAGVKIGYVKNIRLVKHRALITMSIFPSVEVPRGSKAALASIGLLGEKYIEIFPGTEPGVCQPGEELPSLPSISFDQLGLLLVSIGEEIKQMSSSLRSLIKEKEREKLSVTLDNLESISQELRHLLEESGTDMKAGIANFSEGAAEIKNETKAISSQIREVASSVNHFLQTSREDLKESLERLQALSDQLNDTLASIERILGRLEKGEGTAGRLLNDPGLYEETEKTVAQIRAVTEKVTKANLFPGIRADYLSAPGKWRGQFSLTVWPQGGEGSYFFSLGMVREPRAEDFLWNLQGGARWGRFQALAGLIQSELGAGLEAELINQKLFFRLEGLAFNRKEGPQWRLFSRYQVSRNFYFLLGVDDLGVAKNRSLILGFGAGRK